MLHLSRCLSTYTKYTLYSPKVYGTAYGKEGAMKVPGGREASLLLGGTLGEQHAHRGEHALPLARQLEAGLGDLLA